jgi:hypothetical protein
VALEEGTEGVFWPSGVKREESLDCFIEAFGTLHYLPCDSDAFEEGFEKIALYVNLATDVPTHAAKQLSSGWWSSKLGVWEDIEHRTLENLAGPEPAYGKVAQILRRSLSN